MIIKSDTDRIRIREATALSTSILKELSSLITAGNTADKIDKLAWELCDKNGVKPSFFGVKGANGVYKYSCCVSVNNEILHGIPKSTRVFKNGDVVKVDFGIIYKGYYTDQCFTYIIGNSTNQDTKLVNIARLATETAMLKAKAGVKTGELGQTMETIARSAGFDTLKMFVGHGVGRGLHEDPEVPAFGPANSGDRLKENMVISVECQVVAGKPEIKVAQDGWTILSQDGGKGAMFEYMVIVGKGEPEILTPMQDWDVLLK